MIRKLAIALAFAVWPGFASAQDTSVAPVAADPKAQLAQQALDLCVNDDVTVQALEARATAAGWPAFRDGRRDHGKQLRLSVQGNGHDLITIIATSNPFPPSPVPTTLLECTVQGEGALKEPVERLSRAKFGMGSSDPTSFSILEGGALRAMTITEMLADEFPGLLRTITPAQRLVIVAEASNNRLSQAQISVFRTQPAS